VIAGGVFPEASWQQNCSHTEFKFSTHHAIVWLSNVGWLMAFVAPQKFHCNSLIKDDYSHIESTMPSTASPKILSLKNLNLLCESQKKIIFYYILSEQICSSNHSIASQKTYRLINFRF
jgi:hypothetical protein